MEPVSHKTRTVGLLGGSFNPAHAGHLHITLHALNRLGLDEVWWLVSPQNPLKSKKDLAPYEKRFAAAQQVASDKRIRVSDFEHKIGARYSYQAIAALMRRYPHIQFVWLMGADNLAQFHRWKRWQEIMHKIPIITFDRAPYSHRAPRSKVAQFMRKFMLKNTDIGAPYAAPGLHLVYLKRDPHSSSEIRKRLGKAGHLGHNKNAG